MDEKLGAASKNRLSIIILDDDYQLIIVQHKNNYMDAHVKNIMGATKLDITCEHLKMVIKCDYYRITKLLLSVINTNFDQ